MIVLFRSGFALLNLVRREAISPDKGRGVATEVEEATVRGAGLRVTVLSASLVLRRRCIEPYLAPKALKLAASAGG